MRHSSGSLLRGRFAWTLGLPFLFLSPLEAGPPAAAPAPAAGGQVTTPVAYAASAAQATAKAKENQDVAEKRPDVIFVPTPQEVVDKMLELAEVKKSDVVYDLGCGDGRIVVTAAKKHGARGIGMDVDPERIRESRDNVQKSGVGNLVTIKQADIFQADLSGASVITLYLLPELNVRLMPKLKQLKPGTRIVSHDFDMKGARPKKVATVHVDDDEGDHLVYLWVVPWEDE